MLVVNRNVMEEVWETIRLDKGFNASPKRDKNYLKLFVWTNENKINTKRQSKENMPSHSKHCSYAFMYVYMLVQSYLYSYWYPINQVPSCSHQHLGLLNIFDVMDNWLPGCPTFPTAKTGCRTTKLGHVDKPQVLGGGPHVSDMRLNMDITM